MTNKRVYLFSVFYIAVYATAFIYVYPSVSPGAVMTVLAILGFLSALLTDYILRKLKAKKAVDNGE